MEREIDNFKIGDIVRVFKHDSWSIESTYLAEVTNIDRSDNTLFCAVPLEERLDKAGDYPKKWIRVEVCRLEERKEKIDILEIIRDKLTEFKNNQTDIIQDMWDERNRAIERIAAERFFKGESFLALSKLYEDRFIKELDRFREGMIRSRDDLAHIKYLVRIKIDGDKK